MKSLFLLDTDQLTIENRELLLISFNKELEAFNDRLQKHRLKIQMKEDYCFGDIDRIIDLYLDQFDLKNIEELNDFPRKLKALIN